MRVLVTGASGFAGALLIPRLCRAGHEVLALGRDPARLAPAPDPGSSRADENSVQLIRGDVLTGAGLARAMDGVQVAYYLIHSM